MSSYKKKMEMIIFMNFLKKIFKKNENKAYEMTNMSVENQLLSTLINISENGTTKRVKRDVPIAIEALETLPNPEQLFTTDNTHTLLADLHIIRNILNHVKYADGKHSREAWDMNGNCEMIPASKYMNVADAVSNINSALHVKKLGYEMPSKDWERLYDFNLYERTDINLDGFKSFDFEADSFKIDSLKHALRVMLGVFEAINDFKNAEEVKRVLNNL